jgi:peptidoglycan/xylan/chitin deacetylase (PgdA/CDA1 family)
MLNVILTFGDSLQSHLSLAYLLYRNDIPATFFVIASLTKHPHSGKPLLDARGIKTIHDMGHEIASHSCTHRNLIGLSENEILYEVKCSKEYLESIINDEVFEFAYPYGLYINRVIYFVRRFYKYGRSIYLKSVQTCDIKSVFKGKLPIDKYRLCGLSSRVFYLLYLKGLIESHYKNQIYILVFHIMDINTGGSYIGNNVLNNQENDQEW